MQLAHQVWESRLTVDGTVRHDLLLAVEHAVVGLLQFFGNLIDEMVLLGNCDRRRL